MFEIAHLPAIMDPAVLASGPPLLRTGSEAAAQVLKTAVADASPGRIAQSWHVVHAPGAGPLSWGVVSTHPGAGPLNFSAHWPGRMPPWGPDSPLAAWAESKGLKPFLVARALQRRGGFAAAYGGRYEDFVRRAMDGASDQVSDMLYRRGLKLWLDRLGRG